MSQIFLTFRSDTKRKVTLEISTIDTICLYHFDISIQLHQNPASLMKISSYKIRVSKPFDLEVKITMCEGASRTQINKTTIYDYEWGGSHWLFSSIFWR